MSAVAPAWSPTTEQMHSSRLWRFMRAHQCATYTQLCERAARDPDWFWDALVKDLDIVWSAPYHAVMDVSPGLPFTRWFPGGLLNAYDSAVPRHGRLDPHRGALLGENPAGEPPARNDPPRQRGGQDDPRGAPAGWGVAG